MGMDQAELDAVMFQQDLALHGRQYQQGYNKHGLEKSFRLRLGKSSCSSGSQRLCSEWHTN